MTQTSRIRTARATVSARLARAIAEAQSAEEALTSLPRDAQLSPSGRRDLQQAIGLLRGLQGSVERSIQEG